MNTSEIRLNQKLNPESKVYMIANELHNCNKINDDLWYAILDLKEKYFDLIMSDLCKEGLSCQKNS